jgi:hypothetical protein
LVSILFEAVAPRSGQVMAAQPMLTIASHVVIWIERRALRIIIYIYIG